MSAKVIQMINFPSKMRRYVAVDIDRNAQIIRFITDSDNNIELKDYPSVYPRHKLAIARVRRYGNIDMPISDDIMTFSQG